VRRQSGSGDGAFGADGNYPDWQQTFVRSKSGVALRLPPQSKMAGDVS